MLVASSPVVQDLQLGFDTMFESPRKRSTNYESDAWVELRRIVVALIRDSTSWVPSRQLTQKVYAYFLPEGMRKAETMKRKTGELLPHMVKEGTLLIHLSRLCQEEASALVKSKYASYMWSGTEIEEDTDLDVSPTAVEVLSKLFPVFVPGTTHRTTYVLSPNLWYLDDYLEPDQTMVCYPKLVEEVLYD